MTGSLHRSDVEPMFKAPPRQKRKWRKAVKSQSDKRAEKAEMRERLRQAVFARDGGCVLAGETPWECAGIPTTVHHRRKASACGYWSLKNLITLCSFHNQDIENRPGYYRRFHPWLVVREGDAEWKSLGP